MDLYLHDAFISYSRKDRPFAVLLERTLRRYTPPSGLPVPKRRLNIFRDEEDFTGTEYYQAVGRHLQGSRKLIIICSPNARASSFVNDEIQRFAQVHSAEDLIPVLIAGSPETTNAADDADMAFPAALCERLELPLASDYRGFDPKSSKLHSTRYRTSWYKLLADICNCSRAEIERREGRRKFRRRIQWGGAVALISTSLAVTAFVAEKESRSARSNDLANQALGIAESDPERGTSLALEAGFEYNSSLMGDDIPYALKDGNASLLEFPVDWTLDDFPHYAHNRDLGYRMPISPPQRAMEVFRSEFDAAWEFGALWISVWHPALSGRLARFKAVLELLGYMRAKGGVWFARLDQVCDHVQKLMAEGRWTPRYETLPLYESPLPEFSKDR